MTRCQKQANEELERDDVTLKTHAWPPPASELVSSRLRPPRYRRAETSPSILVPPSPSCDALYVSGPSLPRRRRAKTTASVPARVWKGAMPGHFGYTRLPGSSGAAMQQQQQKQPDRGAVAPSSLSSAAAGHGASLPSSSMVRPPPDHDTQLGAGGTNPSTSLHHHQRSSQSSASGSQPRAPSYSTIRKKQARGSQLRPASAHAAATSTSSTTKALMAESPVKVSRSEASAVSPGEEGQVVDHSLGEEKRKSDEGRAEAGSSLKKSYAPASIKRKTSVKRGFSRGEEEKRDEEEGNSGGEAGVGNPRNTSGRDLRSGKRSVKKTGSEDEMDEGGKTSAGTTSKTCESTAGSRKKQKAKAEVDKKMKEEDEPKDDTTSSSNSTMGMRLRTASQRKKPAKWNC